MSPRLITIVLFLLFLIGYAIQKYMAAAPPIFVPEYLGIVLLLVLITGVIPFLLAWLGLTGVKSFPAFPILTFVTTIGLSALAFSLFWYFSVRHYPNAPPLLELARRGLAPGLFMGAILVLNRWLSLRHARASVAS